jgi:hypothetical protein
MKAGRLFSAATIAAASLLIVSTSARADPTDDLMRRMLEAFEARISADQP